MGWETLDVLYANKPHTIKVFNKIRPEDAVFTDSMYVENVLLNLVENAVKYADNGVSVRISLSICDKRLFMTVEDDGWGIPRKYQKKLFTPFFQVPRDECHNQKGFGLGLAQVKYILKGLGGDITLESEEDKGSKFVCVIPIVSD